MPGRSCDLAGDSAPLRLPLVPPMRRQCRARLAPWGAFLEVLRPGSVRIATRSYDSDNPGPCFK
eukprot:11756624-Alexandrium_andersonii.AAC.1